MHWEKERSLTFLYYKGKTLERKSRAAKNKRLKCQKKFLGYIPSRRAAMAAQSHNLLQDF